MTRYIDTTIPFTELERRGQLPAWLDWFAKHGIPQPEWIHAGPEIIIDDDTRTIEYEGIDPIAIKTVDNPDNAIHRRIVQLEAPALPCPPGLTIRENS